VYIQKYKDDSGLKFLEKAGVQIEQLELWEKNKYYFGLRAFSCSEYGLE
jgi:hypothetical protein